MSLPTEPIPPLSTTVSCSMKVQLPNKYEMAEAFVSVSGVTTSHTPDDIDDILAQSKVVFNKIADRIRQEADALREGEYN